MADATLPAPGGFSTGSTAGEAAWLDRPIVPSWQRIAALAVDWEIAAYVAVLAVGLLLRLWDLGSRAMHHDESLHAYYAWQLFKGAGYKYDPMMHGPFKFEVVPLFYLLFGVGEASARLLPALLGTALIVLPYFLRGHLTRPGALLASLMLALSPTMVYFSRFIRDDMLLAFFSLALFVSIVRYIQTQRPLYLYAATLAAAFAMCTMEAAYITFFIFGTFLIFEALREYAQNREGPVLSALQATSLDTWLTALSLFVVPVVLMYSTFFTNPDGIWDRHHALTSPNRTDILGGLLYWKLQHTVQRGSQPWFYYLLVLPLYEQLAVLFGLAGVVYAAVRPTLVRTCLVWWAVLAFGIYSWAGEKMPWLSVHIALPLILLAGIAVGAAIESRRRWIVVGAGAVFLILLALETHSTFVLNFVDGANPTEMLIYVQTSNDVPHTVQAIDQLAARTGQGKQLTIGLDSQDVGGWPFAWYLRDYTNVTEAASFGTPVCGGQDCSVLLLLDPEFTPFQVQLSKRYVVQRYRWNWWFPEDYKTWFPQHWGGSTPPGVPASTGGLLGTAQDWKHVWDWLIYRKPFGPRGARWLYFLVRRDLVPGSRSIPTSPPGAAVSEVQGPPAASLPAVLTSTLGASGSGAFTLSGPRGIASGPSGTLYVADTNNHRVVEYSANGMPGRAFGSPGAGPGQFSQRDSPQSLIVAPDGNVYVADTWNQRIDVFTSTGHFLRSWGGIFGSAPGQFFGPRGVAVSSAGRVYVADTGNKRIQVFTTAGRFLYAWGSAGTGTGQFQEPSSVALGPGGDVYVSDFWNQRIQEFSPAGTFIRSWRVTDWTPGQYEEPYLAVDRRTGNVYATDPQQQRVLSYTGSGRLLGAFGSSVLQDPIGVAVQPNGRVAVADATTGHASLFVIGPARATRSKSARTLRPTGAAGKR